MERTGRTLAAATCFLLVAIGLHVRAARADGNPEVARILAHFADEPTVREVQVAAVNYYNVSASRIHSLSRRARLKALVPGISVGFTNSLSNYNEQLNDIVFRNVGNGIADYDTQNSSYIAFTASASWSLDRLVFNAEQLDVLALIGIQNGVQRQVTSLYFVRRRLQIELLLNPPKTLQARLSGELRIEQLTGLLDAYTGGFFSRRIRENRRRASIEGTPQQMRAAAEPEPPGVAGLSPAKAWGQARAARPQALVSPIRSTRQLLMRMGRLKTAE